MDVGEDDRVLEFRSCAWVSAQEIGLLGPLIRGATAILARRFSRTRYLEWIRDHGVTIGACVPAGINMLLSEPVDPRGADLPSLRYITSSSAPLLSEDMKNFERHYGITVAQSFGASELGWVCGSNGADRKVGTVGRPAKHQHVEIVDEDGNPLPPGSVGEIRVTSATQRMAGYLLDDGAIELALPGPRMSGDLGFLDADGYLTITGRARDVIIRGGVNIAPLEIDGVLAEHHDVAEACTIGVPDPIYGEAVVSYVVATPGATPSERALLDHCAARLPAAKVPTQVIFRDALPRNDRGKLDRNALRAEWIDPG
jgi:acyl-coenzyme A synthetase/AMP-(fatty) acid ligase